MGASGSVPLDEALGVHSGGSSGQERGARNGYLRSQLIVLAAAAAVFLGCIVSPPSLMDDVDAVQAQIARNMIDSGDWVTPHLDGIAYMEKSPLKYWLIAASFKIFGVRDWAARLPVSLSAVLLCWLVFRMGAWAWSVKAGLYAGLAMSTCVGLFLFTRFQIPEVGSGGDHRASRVELPARDRFRRTAARRLGFGDGCCHRNRTAVEGAYRRRVPRHRGAAVSGDHAADFLEGDLGSPASLARHRDRAGDRCPVAHSGRDSQSSAVRFHPAQRTGPVSRVFLVLFC